MLSTFPCRVTLRSKWLSKLPVAEEIEQYMAWGSLDDLQVDQAPLRNIRAPLSLRESVADGLALVVVVKA
jgi:hypothetical protein